ncbi:MAG TPA: CTP synthase, partial [Hyphomicrobiales bacterium]|nr:CTP synthase [Hyphomicrobiales bacterium]
KPTQHSVRDLRSIGIQPDILVCRSDHEIPESARRKIALFTNVELPAVVSLQDTATIYSAPLLLHATGLDEIIVQRFGLQCPPADLSEWQRVVDAVMKPEREITIAMVGKYMELLDAYKSLIEAIKHAGIQTHTRVRVRYIDSTTLETDGLDALHGVDGIIVPGGFGERGIAGMVKAANYARTHGIPYLGICLGLHIAVIEFARNVLGLEAADSTEFNRQSPDPVIAMITEWTNAEGGIEQRSEASDLGGTMRLGGQQCRLAEGSLIKACYDKDVIVERHRHRYEVNNNYVPRLEAAGMRITGKSMDGQLMEVIEVQGHPWFLACQFHPEFTSTPRDGHPLFTGFVKAAITNHAQQGG